MASHTLVGSIKPEARKQLLAIASDQFDRFWEGFPPANVKIKIWTVNAPECSSASFDIDPYHPPSIIFIYYYYNYNIVYHHISPKETRAIGQHMKPSYGGIADGWERRGTGADREADAHGIPWHYVLNCLRHFAQG